MISPNKTTDAQTQSLKFLGNATSESAKITCMLPVACSVIQTQYDGVLTSCAEQPFSPGLSTDKKASPLFERGYYRVSTSYHASNSISCTPYPCAGTSVKLPTLVDLFTPCRGSGGGRFEYSGVHVTLF